MKATISVQLYSVREQAAADWAGTMKKIAAMGYPLVEPAGFPGTTVSEAAAVFRDLGLKCPSMHSKLPVGADRNRVIEEAQELGVQYIITGGPPNFHDDFATPDSIKAVADLYNEANEVAAKHGLRVGYHNHWMEMERRDGVPGYRIFFERVAPEVLWEIDTYWVMVGGEDPVSVVREAGPRAKVIHLKDGPGGREEPMTAVGSGKMDMPAVIGAATQTEIMVVELDRCATDMLQALQDSYDYLVGNGFVQGREGGR